MNDKPKHGGARTPGPGKRLGRPEVPAEEKRFPFVVSVNQEEADRIHTAAKAKGTSHGQVVGELARKHLPAGTEPYVRKRRGGPPVEQV